MTTSPSTRSHPENNSRYFVYLEFLIVHTSQHYFIFSIQFEMAESKLPKSGSRQVVHLTTTLPAAACFQATSHGVGWRYRLFWESGG